MLHLQSVVLNRLVDLLRHRNPLLRPIAGSVPIIIEIGLLLQMLFLGYQAVIIPNETVFIFYRTDRPLFPHSIKLPLLSRLLRTRNILSLSLRILLRLSRSRLPLLCIPIVVIMLLLRTIWIPLRPTSPIQLPNLHLLLSVTHLHHHLRNRIQYLIIVHRW